MTNPEKMKLENLIDLFLDEMISDSQLKELEKCLLASAEARKIYLERVSFDALLHDYFSPKKPVALPGLSFPQSLSTMPSLSQDAETQ